jgi:hypothetical protein
VVELGTLAGLRVTGQAVTTIEDEIRLAIPQAHIEVTYPALDWKRSEPSNLVTRLERQIHRLPDTLTNLQSEADTARAEADRAATRIGAPWDRADELSGLRRRQGEINDTLAAAANPEPVEPAGPPPSAAELTQPVVETPSRSVPQAGGSGLSL